MTQAYGPRHETPDGVLCWMGRIDRAYQMLAKAPNDKTRSAVEKLCVLGKKDLDWADKKSIDYIELCRLAGVKSKTVVIPCDCFYCQRVPTIHGPTESYGAMPEALADVAELMKV